jgi:outer membrane protein assembly factor BamB
MILRHPLARVAAVALVAGLLAGPLAGCAGIKTPSFFGLANRKPKERAAEGQRIPVLGSAEQLEVSPSLQGVDFSVPPPQPQASWPLPGGDAEQAVEHLDAGQTLRVVWRKSIGIGTTKRSHVTASPVVADGMIFTLDGMGGVDASDAGTGREIWRDQFAPPRGFNREAFGGGLAYSDGTLFVTSGYRFVAAVDAHNGNVKWRYDTIVPMHGAPNVADGKLYTVDVNDQLMTFDPADGRLLWTYQALTEPARMLEASSPAISSGVVVAPFASGEIVALSAVNGQQLWEDTLSQTSRDNALSEIRDIGGRPVIYRGDVIAGSHSGVLAAIDLHTGQRRWSLPISTITSPWPAGDVIYVTDTSGKVICIARDSGQVYWIDDLNKGVKKKFRATYSGPVLADNRLLVVDSLGRLDAFDPKTGKRMTMVRLGSPAFLNPIGVNGALYILTMGGDLVALR